MYINITKEQIKEINTEIEILNSELYKLTKREAVKVGEKLDVLYHVIDTKRVKIGVLDN